MTEIWASTSWDETVQFDVRGSFSKGGVVSVWAGDELDPCYLTPAEARRAAVEWPAILLRLAAEAEQVPTVERGTA